MAAQLTEDHSGPPKIDMEAHKEESTLFADKFKAWLSEGPRSSVAPIEHASANDMIALCQEFREKLKPRQSGNKENINEKYDDQGRLLTDIFELLMMLPLELQLLIFEYLSWHDILRLSTCSKSLQRLMHLLSTNIMATRPNIRVQRSYLAKFNFKDVPFVEALNTWNWYKGIDYNLAKETELNGLSFAKFYFSQNKDADERLDKELEDKVDRHAKLTSLLTHLHLATHQPHREQLSEPYRHLQSVESYKIRIRQLCAFNEGEKIEFEDAITKIEKNKGFLTGRKIWLLRIPRYQRNYFYDSEGHTQCNIADRDTELGTVRTVLANIDACGDVTVNEVPRRLGLPLLPCISGIPHQDFMYCDGEQLRHLTDMLQTFRPGAEDIFPDVPTFAKIYLIDHLTIY